MNLKSGDGAVTIVAHRYVLAHGQHPGPESHRADPVTAAGPLDLEHLTSHRRVHGRR